MEKQDTVLYHEPSILTILIQSSFLLALVSIDFALDSLVYCGLVGQILVGLAYGTPGGDILGLSFQQMVTDLGYLGLILLVFEGGLSTDIKALRSNALLSVLVALTGISLPIGISFVLTVTCDATVLQAFAAGCALSSTSLGTTLTILKASGLDQSRLGVILTSAAMLDDVVGLILVQVISNLGSSGEGFTAVIVVRPLLVSLAYALVVPLVLYMGKKMFVWFPLVRSDKGVVFLSQSARGQLVLHTVVLIAGVASAAYAGTSTLLAAYLAGLLIVSYESLIKGQKKQQKSIQPVDEEPKSEESSGTPTKDRFEDTGSWEVVVNPERNPAQNGLSQPVKEEQPSSESNTDDQRIAGEATAREANKVEDRILTNMAERPFPANTAEPSGTNAAQIFNTYYAQPLNRILKPFFFASIGFSIPIARLFTTQILWRGIVYAILMGLGKACCGLWLIRVNSIKVAASGHQVKMYKLRHVLSRLASYRPQSLYPACMLGSAMVSRGEIGFLISAIAESNGLFDQEVGGDQIYLVVTWAILLCTIAGPISVGMMARRVKRLETTIQSDGSSGAEGSGKEHPLGIWNDIQMENLRRVVPLYSQAVQLLSDER